MRVINRLGAGIELSGKFIPAADTRSGRETRFRQYYYAVRAVRLGNQIRRDDFNFTLFFGIAFRGEFKRVIIFFIWGRRRLMRHDNFIPDGYFLDLRRLNGRRGGAPLRTNRGGCFNAWQRRAVILFACFINFIALDRYFNRFRIGFTVPGFAQYRHFVICV